MSSTSSNRILSIYKSRMTILDFMERLNYDVSEYNVFSINEIDAMLVNSQLDMLITHTTGTKKVYIKYYFSGRTGSGQIRPQTLDTIVEDLYDIENVLDKDSGTLIIIIDEEPNETIINKLKYIYERSGIFVVIHNIKRLQFNILEHKLIPKIKMLSEEEMTSLMHRLNLKSVLQLPEISRFDPLALAITMRPGQVAQFTRSSATALEDNIWRVCV